jgi:hypothetical protein
MGVIVMHANCKESSYKLMQVQHVMNTTVHNYKIKNYRQCLFKATSLCNPSTLVHLGLLRKENHLIDQYDGHKTHHCLYKLMTSETKNIRKMETLIHCTVLFFGGRNSK